MGGEIGGGYRGIFFVSVNASYSNRNTRLRGTSRDPDYDRFPAAARPLNDILARRAAQRQGSSA